MAIKAHKEPKKKVGFWLAFRRLAKEVTKGEGKGKLPFGQGGKKGREPKKKARKKKEKKQKECYFFCG